jgi:hypothetical protein
MAIGHGGQLLCSSQTAGLVETDVELVDLGEHRLRDLDQADACVSGGRGLVRANAAVGLDAENLPVRGTSCVGRAVESAAVAKELGTARLVTLTEGEQSGQDPPGVTDLDLGPLIGVRVVAPEHLS